MYLVKNLIQIHQLLLTQLVLVYMTRWSIYQILGSNITCILWTNDEAEVLVEFLQACFQDIISVQLQKLGMFQALLAPKNLYISLLIVNLGKKKH